MGRNAFRYSGDQREAIAQAVLDWGFTAREAVEKAAAGELGIPAFEVPLSTAQGFVTQARHDRPPAQGPNGQTGRLRAVADRAIGVIEAEMAKAEASSKRGSLDLPRIKRALQAAQHLARLEQLLALPQPRAEPTSQQTSASARLLGQMQRDLASETTEPAAGTSDATEPTADELRARMLAELTAAAEAAHIDGKTGQD